MIRSVLLLTTALAAGSVGAVLAQEADTTCDPAEIAAGTCPNIEEQTAPSAGETLDTEPGVGTERGNVEEDATTGTTDSGDTQPSDDTMDTNGDGTSGTGGSTGDTTGSGSTGGTSSGGASGGSSGSSGN